MLYNTNLYSQDIDKGRFYFSLGNAFNTINPTLMYNYNLNTVPDFGSFGLSSGNEWITDITIDDNTSDFYGENYLNPEDRYSTTNFSFHNQSGYFIIDKLLVGIKTEYSYAKLSSKYINPSNYTELNENNETIIHEEGIAKWEEKLIVSTLAFAPFIKYFIPFKNNAFFINSAYSFGVLKGTQSTSADYPANLELYYSDFNTLVDKKPMRIKRLEFSTGICFFLTKDISLDPSINFCFNTYTQRQEMMSPISGENEEVNAKYKTNALYFKIAASIYL